MKRRDLVTLALVLGVWSMSACSDEPCGGGVNMTDPRIEGGFDSSAESPTLRVVWGPGTGKGAELPSTYFDAVELRPRPGDASSLVTGLERTGSREIVLTFSSVQAYLEENQSFVVLLEFPDRRRYIDCDHAGMQDFYMLTVTLEFDEHGVLLAGEVRQWVDAGAI